MIVSHKHKFIFIKTQKTAGTSIEIALSKFCGPEDIITRISSVDEKLRRSLGYPGAQNCYKTWNEFNRNDWYRQLIKLRRPKKFYNHMPATMVRDYIGKETWDSYYKFCFERNPWDKAVSMYYWKNKIEPRPSFHDYLDNIIGRGETISAYSLYSLNNQLLVDKIYRFEDIERAMIDIKETLNLPELPPLPKTKTGTNKSKSNYRELYDAETRKKVATMFQQEIKILDYTF